MLMDERPIHLPLSSQLYSCKKKGEEQPLNYCICNTLHTVWLNANSPGPSLFVKWHSAGRKSFFFNYLIHLSTCLFIRMQPQTLILFTGLPSTTDLIYFNPQIVTDFTCRSPFNVPPTFPSWLQVFWVPPYFLAQQETHLYLPCPALESTISPRSVDSFRVGNGIYQIRYGL